VLILAGSTLSGDGGGPIFNSKNQIAARTIASLAIPMRDGSNYDLTIAFPTNLSEFSSPGNGIHAFK
jgi:hypothetical protein